MLRTLIGFVLTTLAAAQTTPLPSPSPSLQSKHTTGLEINNLATPKENQNLKWQKIIVGAEPIDGAALMGLPKNSAWRRLGFQSGDIIVRINDKDLHSTEDFDSALSGLKKEQKSSIDFRVIRGSHEMILDYKITW